MSSSETRPVLYTPRAVAQILGLHEVSLARWRALGKGPGFLKLGRSVRYPQEEVERFLAASRRGGTATEPRSRVAS